MYREHHAALGGAVDLGDDESGDRDRFGECLRLHHRVLSDSRIENEQSLVGSSGEPLPDDTIDLLHLVHQRSTGVKSAGRVDDDDILSATDAGVDGVERDRGGVGTGVAADELRAGAVGPAAQLIDRAGPERVSGANEYRHLIGLEEVGEFPDERRLPRAVHSHDQENGGSHFRANDAGIAVARSERRFDRFPERQQKLVLALDESAARLSLDLSHEPEGRGDAEVGLEEDHLEGLQRALDGASTGDRGDVGESDILYFGPERAGRHVTRALQYSACHLSSIAFRTKKNPDFHVRVEDKSEGLLASLLGRVGDASLAEARQRLVAHLLEQ